MISSGQSSSEGDEQREVYREEKEEMSGRSDLGDGIRHATYDAGSGRPLDLVPIEVWREMSRDGGEE